MERKKTKGEIQMSKLSIFISNYKNLTKSEMIGKVGVKEEAQLSDDENTLNDILMYNENTISTTYSLLKMKSLCETMIYHQSNAIQFFQSQLVLIQSSLK